MMPEFASKLQIGTYLKFFQALIAMTNDSPARHVFVYGTLRRGEERDITHLTPAPAWVGTASIAGELYDLGTYPGLRLDGPQWISGEVYRISDELEQRLDEIEGLMPEPTGEYQKREITVQLDTKTAGVGVASSDEINCVVYEATPAGISGHPRIEGNDWVRYRKSKKSAGD